MKKNFPAAILSELPPSIKKQLIGLIKELNKCPYLKRCGDCRLGFVDSAGRFLSVNKRMRELVGDVTGEDVANFLAADDQQILGAAREKSKVENVENLLIRVFDNSDGPYWVNVYYSKRCPDSGVSVFRTCPIKGAKNIFTLGRDNKAQGFRDLAGPWLDDTPNNKTG